MEDNMWINALKENYRYKLGSHILTTEDLFTLSLEELDELYTDFSIKINKLNAGKSLLESRNDDEIKFLVKHQDIVSNVFDIKSYEKEQLDNAYAVKMQKQKLSALIDKKQDEALNDLSIDELKEMLDQL